MNRENITKRQRRIYLLFGATAAMLLLLVISLYLFERSAPDTSIHSMTDTVWYILTTLTTVGYGDIYPVTSAGRVIGGLFSLMSTWLLALLIGLAVSRASGYWLPYLRLMTRRRSPWMVFSGDADAVCALADNVAAAYPEAVLILHEPDAAQAAEILSRINSSIIRTDLSFRALLKLRRARPGLYAFVLENDISYAMSKAIEYRNTAAQAGLDEASCRICCRGYSAGMLLPNDVTGFDEELTAARLYWRGHLLASGTKRVVIAGPAVSCENMLEQGLLMNVYSPGQAIRYDVFGAGADFLKKHYRLGNGSSTAVINDESEDTVILHSGSIFDANRIISDADRIILCDPDANNNLRILAWLMKLVPVKARIDYRSALSDSAPGDLGSGAPFASPYGSYAEIYTPEFILNDELNRNARRMNAAYYSGVGLSDPGWDSLSDFTKRSNMAAADHIPVKKMLLGGKTWQEAAEDPSTKEKLRFTEHIRWVRFHLMNNWEYAPIRNDALRRHPLIVPYEDLSEEDRKKDEAAWEILEIF